VSDLQRRVEARALAQALYEAAGYPAPWKSLPERQRDTWLRYAEHLQRRVAQLRDQG
jgi:myo-inositol catabolism protein IolC